MQTRRLAILNRGGPAMRALDAVAELNADGSCLPITTIAVYTDPDAQAWFVRSADEVIALGPATYVDPITGSRTSSYLDEERVIAALLAAHADTVWVGWGFAAEHASFAQRCEKAGIVFVGPASETIRMLGDKVAAKRLAEKVDVPVVAWSGDALATAADAHEPAERLGYPVLLKAAAGGGGRGIRLVRKPAELAAAFVAAQAEAMLAFGDSRVFLEQYVERARHVEVQIIADHFGTTWALGVRDCSVQRRHQKVIEESGSTILDAAGEQAIREAAVRIAVAAGYRNAGTVEFLVEPETGAFRFMEVNTRLQVEHPVTEETSGVDLVKLQLHIAGGGRLDPTPPATRGYAFEARLCAEDPQQGFAPAPGRIALWRPPAGPGIRVDAGISEGETIAPEFDSLIAKIIAWGRDRSEALARLRRAMSRAVVVIENGTTNQSFLVGLLANPELRRGDVDSQWLDRLVAVGGHVPHADPIAVLIAAVEAYDSDEAAAREAFHAGARIGRPDAPETAGHRVRLRYRGRGYDMTVFRTGADQYLVDMPDVAVALRVERIGRYERRAVVADEPHAIVTVAQRSSFLVDVDGRTHRVYRDDGGVVRAGWPAFVISVLVEVGDPVAIGDPLAVLESMKMETTVLAPFAGEVAEVCVSPNTQIDQGAPLVQIREVASDAEQPINDRLDFAPLAYVPPEATSRGPSRCEALHAYLLGFELDPATLAALTSTRPGPCDATDPDDRPRIDAEDGLLELFADICALYRPLPDETSVDYDTSPHEHVLAYLQWLDAERAGLPERFRAQLRKMLARYGVDGLDRTPALEQAVVWMWRSLGRADEVVPAVTTLLERRLRDADLLSEPPPTAQRTLLGLLAQASQARYPDVADLARDLLFHYFDEPLLERAIAGHQAEMASHLDALEADPRRADRAALIERLVHCPQPMRAMLLARWPAASPAFREVLLDVHLHRFYRIRQLRDVRFEASQNSPLAAADYVHEGHEEHVVAMYAPLEELTQIAAAVAAHLAATDPATLAVVDLTLWRSGDAQTADELATELGRLLSGCAFGRALHRLDVTLTSAGTVAEYKRTHHFTFRQSGTAFVEELLFRNLHPMIAERLDIWRLWNFQLDRLRSVEDVYAFRGVARDNPKDVRFFAVAEVRDLTPALDEAGRVVGRPLLERMGLQALAAMREAMAELPPGRRPQGNRIVLYVRPPWTLPLPEMRELGRRYHALAAASGVVKLQLRVHIPDGDHFRDAVYELTGFGQSGLRMRERGVAEEPIRSLTAYQQKVNRAGRLGAPYPYEIVRTLTPPSGVDSDFPPGHFVEYDLGPAGELVPVDRPYGGNLANLVVGLITSYPDKVPEGMTRVAILGDPTQRLGALAEPECLRIIGALDLAERLGVPVEWFALSSGARIAMDSGTENMDWIGAVLRKIIEFTQRGGEINVVVTGINVGAQPYWNAEATMLMHTRGILIMTPASAMVLTGKQALGYSGGVSAEDNFGIGGFERVMGPNGQGQYWAPTVEDACRMLMRHYEHTYVVPGERFPRRRPTSDPIDRDVCSAPHRPVVGSDFTVVGDVFSAVHNPERKKPFDIRSVMRAVADADAQPLERWARWRGAESAVVWDAHIGGLPVCLLGFESRALARRGFRPADGPPSLDVGNAVPAVLPQDRPGGQRGEREPPGRRAGQPVRLRRFAGVDAALAARVRRGDRPRGDELRGPDRVRRRLPLSRRGVRRLLETTQRESGDRCDRGLLRFGDRRRPGGRGRVHPRGRRPYGARPAGGEPSGRVGRRTR